MYIYIDISQGNSLCKLPYRNENVIFFHFQNQRTGGVMVPAGEGWCHWEVGRSCAKVIGE
jgi:hypothetical protein